MSITFLQLAEKVLSHSKLPLSVDQVWQQAVQNGYEQELSGSGKTPVHTLGAQLYTNVKTGPASKFVGIGNRPKRFYLRSRHSEMDFSETVLTADELPTPAGTSFLEKDLHPFLAYFVSKQEFSGSVYSKTLDHTKSSKSSYGQWVHPDIVGCYFPDWEAPTKNLSQVLGNASLRLFSFELKRELSFKNLRESFFQAVSNSSWANQGYLCAATISEDPDFHAELQRLSESFGIGIVHLDITDPDSSNVMFQARERGIDWESVDKLCEMNPDFRVFLERVKIDFTSGVVHTSEYDQVLSVEQLKASTKLKT